MANDIVCENSKTGTPSSVWDISGAGDSTIQGFATDISVNQGGTVFFKINTNAKAYTITIFRMGYYSGNGARQIATVSPSVTLPQTQPACMTNATTFLYDCGNWAVSASWPVPSNATSGIYFARIVRTDTGGENHIVFIVRNDVSHSDVLFQTADETWQAYNAYGGHSVYGGADTFDLPNRAYKVSYNRPFITRGFSSESATWVFGAEYPMVRWLEANGYDVTYFTGIDAARSGNLILNHKVYMDTGHDEYVSGPQRTNIEAARDAGVNLAFFSGNEFFWKTRWENSIDGTNTAYRTMVVYKETLAFAKIDPADPPTWTGTWRDPGFSPPADGGRPENALTGTIFMVNGPGSDNPGNLSIRIPAADGKMRFWRNTTIANLASGQTATLPAGTLGYEWDEDLDNGARPAGTFDLSTATYNMTADLLLDYGATYGAGTATHHMTMHRAPSGALVFGAGTVQWSWGLDSNHDNSFFSPNGAPNPDMQQATVNLFADMGAQPASLQGGLLLASKSTDKTPPTSTITFPTAGSILMEGNPITITGTAADNGGGVVGGVEVSEDGGTTWHPASGRESWSYTGPLLYAGSTSIQSRAVDDSGNLETPSPGISVTVSCPCSVWNSSGTPTFIDSADANSTTLGVKFRADSDGFITGIRFYKASTNTGTHIGNIWTRTGTLLGSATFTNETGSGWQQVNFSSPIAVSANTTYVASYFAPKGHYSQDEAFFASSGVDHPPLHLLAAGVDGPNGMYVYASSNTFPTSTYNSEYYWIDVVYSNNLGPTWSISGTINPAAYGSGATVTLSGAGSRTVTADSSGNYTFANLLNGSYTIQPSKSGFTFSPTSQPVTISGANVSGVNFTAQVIPPPTCPCRVWNSSPTPTFIDSADPSATNLGVKFRADFSGYITGLRFYKASTNTGTHIGNIWTSTGTLLGSVTFANETSSGWQQMNFTNPIAVNANTTYIGSYFAPNGHYSQDEAFFATSGVDNPPLHLLAAGVDGPNGMYVYASSNTFPTSTYNSEYYWIDIIYTLNISPDLTVAKSHTGNFIQGQTGAAYSITVNNIGGNPTSGTVTLADTLPAGLTATAMSGTGWTCTLATLSCTRSDALAASTSYPAITVTVNVASNAPASVTNTATVSGGGESNTSNDTANDVTTITGPPDLTVAKSHTGNFTQGQTGAAYTITVNNIGTGPTSGTVTLTDTLPAGLTATAMSGTGWTCTLATLSCTRSDALAASTSYPAITVTVNVASNAPASVTNTATVSGGGESNTSNDTANDVTTISAGAVSIAIDVTTSKDQSTASSTVVTPTFSTASGNELLLALIATDYLSGTNTTVTGVSGAGLTWVLVVRTNTRSGTSEIWRAFATAPLSGVTVTATLSQSVISSMTVMSFTGVSTSGNGSGATGATKSASAASGAPTATLVTTQNSSWVLGVGNDYDNATARTLGTGQRLVHQYLTPTGDTYWMQIQNAPTPLSGTSVTINDTAPTGDQYNLSICEILPGTVTNGTPPSVTMSSPAPSGTVTTLATVSANATDSNYAITGVQFLLDGGNLGTQVNSAPYSITWDSSAVTAGTHTLSAIAYNSAGMNATASPMTVTVDHSGNSAVVGSWSSVLNLPTVAMNLILLKNNKLMFYEDGGSVTIWDYLNNVFTSAPVSVDLFCSGFASLADGRILVVGGYGGGTPIGIANAEIFDPSNNSWTTVPNMSYRRWYPTATTLSDGRIMVTAGWQTTNHTNAGIPEIYDPSTNQWTQLTNANNPFETYPFMFVLQDGRIIHVGGTEYATNTDILNVSTQSWSVVDSRIIDGGAASMYLPGKIMKSGSATDSQGTGPSINTTFVLDTTQSTPAWQQTPSMAYSRSFLNLTELPDGSVLATGGETDKNGGNIANAVYAGELWSPQTQTWTTMSSMKTPREYHSTALLLPDARVLVSGMGNDFGQVPNETNAEIFSPPYLFQGARPAISLAPAQIQYAANFSVNTPDYASISKVVLIRTGATTHFFDQNTRYVPLAFQQTTGGLTVTGPVDGNLAPPGYYMLFLVNSSGVPSVASIVQIP